jgi:hypothetical protein
MTNVDFGGVLFVAIHDSFLLLLRGGTIHPLTTYIKGMRESERKSGRKEKIFFKGGF